MRFDKEGNRLLATLAQVGLSKFPEGDISVQSSYTGRTVLFKFDTEAAAANEYWDGEEAHYYCAASNVKATKLILMLN